MMWFFAIVVVLVLGAIAFAASGRGAPLAPAYDDRPDALAPTGRKLTGDDLRKVRFSLALRGYRMSEVDELLDRLAREREDESEPPEPTESTEPTESASSESASSESASSELASSESDPSESTPTATTAPAEPVAEDR